MIDVGYDCKVAYCVILIFAQTCSHLCTMDEIVVAGLVTSRLEGLFVAALLLYL